MARVWFVRRRGGQWVAPGGQPAFEMPLGDLIFRLDLATHRRVDEDLPLPAADMPPQPPTALQRVMVEVEPKDLTTLEFTGYQPGFYDSPYTPHEAARRLAAATARPARAAN